MTNDAALSPATVVAALSDAAAAVATLVSPSIVSIGTDGRGTGVVIGPDRVLTSAHHLRDRTTSVGFHDGRTAQGTAIGLDLDGDLAVLSVPTNTLAALGWSTTPAVLGTVAFAAARGSGEFRLTLGLVSGTERSFHSGTGHLVNGALEHSAPLARGSSGGPLLDVSGAMMAVTTRRERGGFALARPADDRLVARVAELAAGRSTPRRRLGVVLAGDVVAARMRASVGLTPRQGLLVRAVAPGSSAAAAGIEGGDLLVTAGGTALKHPEDLHQVLAETSDVVVVTVVRGETERQVTVSFAAAAEPLGRPDISA